MQQQRLTDRLITYWNTLRKEQPMPEFARFNKAVIDDLWQSCIMFIVVPGQGRPSYQYFGMGDKVRQFYPKDVTGMPAQLAPQFKGAAIIKRIDEILANPQPIYDEGHFITDGHKVVKYRSCLLPFGDSNGVTHVVAGLSWREF